MRAQVFSVREPRTRRRVVDSVELHLVEAEQRVAAVYAEFRMGGWDVAIAAFHALSALSRPDPMFVGWLSKHTLTVINGRVFPATDEVADLLFDEGLWPQRVSDQ